MEGSDLLRKGHFCLNCEGGYVLNVLYMPHRNAVMALVTDGSYGAYVLIELGSYKQK